MADLAGPQKRQKSAKKQEPQKTLEIPEDSARDPRKAENCQENVVSCHLTQENAPEERYCIECSDYLSSARFRKFR